MKYEEKLWNKHDLLHERYRRQYETTSNLLEMLTKMQSASKEYSKVMKNIFQKNLQVTESADSTLGRSLECLKFDFSLQANEFNEMGDFMKTKVIDPIKEIIDSSYTKEKEKYNELKKSLNQYASSLSYLEKAHNKFKLSGESAERSTLFAKQLKFSLANDIEKDKSYQKAKSTLLEAQENEKYYITQLDAANKCRKDAIEKQTSLLQMYQGIDKELGYGLKNLICIYVATVKKVVSSILLDLESLGDKWQNIIIENDMQSFIDKNASNLVPDSEIKFEAYKPNLNPEVPINNQIEIPFEVIFELKSYLKDVLPSFDLALEEKKSKIRKLSLKVFTSNNDFVFSPEEKNQLLEYCKDQQSRHIFLYTLNKQRTTGRFARSARLMQDLKDIVNTILAISEPEKDYNSAKNCIILSQTFYIEEKGEKKYLFESIMNNKWLTSNEFWYGVIEKMIQMEFERSEKDNKEIISHESEEDKKKRISNIAFSQVLPYTNNMLDFKMDKNVILEVISKFVKEYNIEKDLEEAIVNNVKERPY